MEDGRMKQWNRKLEQGDLHVACLPACPHHLGRCILPYSCSCVIEGHLWSGAKNGMVSHSC